MSFLEKIFGCKHDWQRIEEPYDKSLHDDYDKYLRKVPLDWGGRGLGATSFVSGEHWNKICLKCGNLHLGYDNQIKNRIEREKRKRALLEGGGEW